MGTYEDQRKYQRLLAFWRRAWGEAGFTARVEDASRGVVSRSLERQMRSAFDQMPTVNHRDYEWHCFRRWLVLYDLSAMYQGPLLVVDGDTFPRPEHARHPFFQRPASVWTGGFDILDAYNNPSAVLTGLVGLRSWIDTLIGEIPHHRTHVNGQPHCSDMIIAQATRPLPAAPLCANWGDRRTDLPMVHIGTDSIIAEGFKASQKAEFVANKLGTIKRPAKK